MGTDGLSTNRIDRVARQIDRAPETEWHRLSAISPKSLVPRSRPQAIVSVMRL